MENIEIKRVRMGKLFNKVKSLFTKNMGSYVGYFLLVLLISFVLEKVNDSILVTGFDVFNHMLLTILFLGYSTFAFKSEKLAQVEFSHFFDPLLKSVGVIIFQVLQWTYLLLSFGVILLVVVGRSIKSVISIFENPFSMDSSLTTAFTENIILIPFLSFVAIIPLVIFWMTQQHYIVSDSSIWKSLSVSFSIFKINWLSYFLLISTVIVTLLGFGVTITLIAHLLGDFGFLLILLALPVGCFFFFIVIPMLCLLPYSFYSLAYHSGEAIMIDKIEDFGTVELD